MATRPPAEAPMPTTGKRGDTAVLSGRLATGRRAAGLCAVDLPAASLRLAVIIPLPLSSYCHRQEFVIKTLVSFSGEVIDPDLGGAFTEVAVNQGIEEKQPSEKFDPAKEHGAFASPAGRPRRHKASKDEIAV